MAAPDWEIGGWIARPTRMKQADALGGPAPKAVHQLVVRGDLVGV